MVGLGGLASGHELPPTPTAAAGPAVAGVDGGALGSARGPEVSLLRTRPPSAYPPVIVPGTGVPWFGRGAGRRDDFLRAQAVAYRRSGPTGLSLPTDNAEAVGPRTPFSGKTGPTGDLGALPTRPSS